MTYEPIQIDCIFKHDDEKALEQESLEAVTDSQDHTHVSITPDYDDMITLKRCSKYFKRLADCPADKKNIFELNIVTSQHDKFIVKNDLSLSGLMDNIKNMNRLGITDYRNANPYLQLYAKFFRNIDLTEIRDFKSYFNKNQVNLLHTVCSLAHQLLAYKETNEFKEIVRLYVEKFNSTKQQLNDYIFELRQRYSRICTIRIDLYYNKKFNFKVSSKKAHEDNQKFIDNLKTMYGADLKGYIWKLQYSNQKGFFIRYVIFLNGITLGKQHIRIAKLIGENIWMKQTTEGNGVYVNRNVYNKHQYPVVGITHHDDDKARIGFSKLIDSFIEIDHYIKIFLHPDEKYFGTAELKPISKRGRPRKAMNVLAPQQEEPITTQEDCPY